MNFSCFSLVFVVVGAGANQIIRKSGRIYVGTEDSNNFKYLERSFEVKSDLFYA